MDLQLGLELTFLPNPAGKWKEFRRKHDAIRATAKLNALMRANKRLHNFQAKADPFRQKGNWMSYGNGSCYSHAHDAWIVEVNNKTPLESWEFFGDGSEDNNHLNFTALYDAAESIGLFPHIQQRKKDGTIIHFPSGGGHQHVSLALWGESYDYLRKLGHLERLLTLDFANRPYIRWLFSQWFDDVNSHNLASWGTIDKIHKGFRKSREGTLNYITSDVLRTINFQQRFSAYGKQVYPTWELRFFDMPANYNELRAQVMFLSKWIGYFSDGIHGTDPNAFIKKHLKFTLTQNSFDKLVRNPAYVREEILTFFRQIKLDNSSCFDTLLIRNLDNRIHYGKTI